MGACTFYLTAMGKDAKEAFRNAVESAKYESGHGGYTGTIAEKDSFTIIYPPASIAQMKDIKERQQAIFDYADKLIDEQDKRVDDKWGPAGCIQIDIGKFYFFGWASE